MPPKSSDAVLRALRVPKNLDDEITAQMEREGRSRTEVMLARLGGARNGRGQQTKPAKKTEARSEKVEDSFEFTVALNKNKRAMGSRAALEETRKEFGLPPC